MIHEKISYSFPLPPPPPSAGRMDLKFTALIIISVVLAAGLVSVLAFYQPANLQSQIADKNKIISSLQHENAALQNSLNGNASQIASDNSNITALNSQIANLNATLNQNNNALATDNSEIASYQNITSLNATQILINQQLLTIPNNNSTDAFFKSLNYCGYLVVQATSTSSTTYAQTVYSAFGISFNQTKSIGASGTAVFPFVSSPSAPTTVDVRIGNFDQATSNSTVTITYYY